MTTLEDMKDYQTSSGSAYQVFPKLRGDNYFSWSASMESILRSLCQWQVVTGAFHPPVPADPDNPTEKELQIERAWELRKERAYTEIDLRIEDQQRVSIRDNRDPRLAWHTLRTVYGNRLANTRAALLAEITRVQYDGSGILEHKSRMDALRMKLTEAGHPVAEPLYLNFFVNSLPEEFDAITNTINYDTDTVDKVVSNLRQIETKRGLRTATEGSAFAVTKGKQQKGRSANAPQNPAQGARGGSPKKNVGRSGGCYNCGGQGHWARNCPSPKKKRDGGSHKEVKKDVSSGDSEKTKGNGPSTARGLFAAIDTSMFLGESPITRRCFIDTAASGNFTPKIEDLHGFEPFSSPRSFTAANGAEVQSKGIGTVKIAVSNSGRQYNVEVPHVQWVPGIYTHLFSPGQLIKDGFTVNLHKDGCTVKDPANRLLADVRERGNTYPANFSIVQPDSPLPIAQAIVEPTKTELEDRLDEAVLALTVKPDHDVMKWHQRLGHLNVADVRKLAGSHATGMQIVEDTIPSADCLACIHGKQHKMPFKVGRTRATRIGELIHMDLAGPMETTSFDGKKYFLITVDDYSRGIWVEVLTLKSEVVSKIREFNTQFETGYGAKIRGIMADNGTEFVNNDMQRYLKEKGITLYTSVPYTHEQNGVAERAIRTITEGARAMLHASKLPKSLWSVAVKTMAYLRNRSPARANNGITPIERITGQKPDLAHLRIFGCPVSVAVPKEKRKKWDSRSRMGYMVGYEPYSTGYVVWYPGNRRVDKVRDVVFHEEAVAPAIPTLYGDEDIPRNVNQSPNTAVTMNAPAVSPSTPNPTVQPRLFIRIPARPARVVRGPDDQGHATIEEVSPDTDKKTGGDGSRLVSDIPDFQHGTTRSGKQRGEIQSLLATEEYSDEAVILSAILGDPTNIKDALNLPGEEGEAWERARQAEWQNMIDHDVFGPPTSPPPNTQILKMGTALRTTRQSGKITKRKVRIVAKGYSQVPGLHFNETYAPVMRWESLRILLTLGAISGLEIRQFDVKSAYLHGVIQEEVWVQQPEGFEVPGKEDLALRLRKALYGTKQGGNQWRKTLEEFMTKTLDWRCSDYDRAVFFKFWDDGTWGIVGFWVDDATSIGHKKRLLELENAFRDRFGLSGEDDAHWILGTAITRDIDRHSISISQKNYIEDIAVKFQVQNSKPCRIPIPLGIDFSALKNDDEEDEESKDFPYRELIGSLMYAAIASRPDIAHAINKLAQYSSNPSRAHWKLAKRILQFLYHTRERSLILGGEKPTVYAYADADFAGDTEDRKSTGGYAVFLGNGVVSWSSKKQTIVALSSTEAEYVVLSEATREILWTRRFLEEIGLKFEGPTTIYEDNLGTRAFALDQKSPRRMKHIEVKYHFIKSHIAENTVNVVYMPTSEMTADIFTKFLPPSLYEYHSKALGLATSPLEGVCKKTSVE